MKSSKPFFTLAGILLLFQSLACGLPSTGLNVRPAVSATFAPSASPAPTLTSSPVPSSTSTMIPSTPTLSPDLASLRIAFTYDRKLWLWQNGTARPLTSVEEYAQVHMSDDGEMIAFERQGLWVINRDGSQERLLVSEADFQSMEPKDPGVKLHDFDWIPNTHKLLFNTILRLDYGVSLTDDLYLANAETLQCKRLRPEGEGGRFAVSPDGKRIAMTTPSQISLMNVDGTHYQVVLNYHVPYPSEIAYYAVPTWESDSRSLTVPIPPEDFFYGVTTSPTIVWHLPIDGTAPTVVAELPAGDRGFDSRIWTPNREHFAFWFEEAYHLDTDGTNPNPLTETTVREGWFTWVDETHFIYMASCELRLGTIGAPSAVITSARTADDSCFSSYDFAK